MKAGLKFGGRFMGAAKPSSNVAHQAIEFAIQATRFGFALYEYDQLRKITIDLEDRLEKVILQGEERNIQNAKELEDKKKQFQESLDRERAARIRALQSMEKQLEDQRKKSVRLEKIRLNTKAEEFRQQLLLTKEQLDLIGSSIVLLQDEAVWWKKIIDRQFGDAAIKTMHQVNQLEEDIRKLQVMHKNAAMNMI
ncbi:hypothetical protein OKS35_14235 [Exiguobacterium sp. N5]|uniref:hypothetical protein n=1 Tax=unclassified Exiguobacterium TaxID=2644629 RepID=UPI001BE9D86B|nr:MULTISPECIES: hypothetical protein [unclassified Exiguobacterium]MCV9901283.1 hypothetical protein [Exiguobacterium sp. N5]